MPIVYTPVVGEACQKWSHIYRQQPRGVYISLEQLGRVRSVLDNYPIKDIRAIVFTDGERILGLGDLGANGMGIPIGKLALYSALAGVHPSQCLPVHLDVGTDTQSILDDEAYVGLKRRRDRSQQYDDLIEEFFAACQELYGRNVLLQFEDFGNTNAFRLLHHYQGRACTFNDDIQGTSSVVLAGLISSLGISKTQSLKDHTYLFHGAGEAGAGIASLIADTIAMETGCSIEEARTKIWLVDSKGLITSSRDLAKLEHHKLPFAHCTGPIEAVSSDPLFNAVNHIKPTALIGVSAQGGAFTQAIVEEMCKYSEHPVIFALSNPTSKSECTAEQAYRWTNGRCVFASGSPFDPVTLEDGRRFVPGQGNNAYIFPGVGLAAVVTKASSIIDKDFIVAARALAAEVSDADLSTGCAYPPLSRIREVSLRIAAAVAKEFYDTGRATEPLPEGVDVTEFCRRAMYIPSYTA
jgi:malate dehydrogenase (oxaloacetate-decarboxylating)(NADP+)